MCTHVNHIFIQTVHIHIKHTYLYKTHICAHPYKQITSEEFINNQSKYKYIISLKSWEQGRGLLKVTGDVGQCGIPMLQEGRGGKAGVETRGKAPISSRKKGICEE